MKIRKINRQNKIEKRKHKMKIDNRSLKTINYNRHNGLKFCFECNSFVKVKRGKCKAGHYIT